MITENDLEQDIIEFLFTHHINYNVLPNILTQQLNDYLKNYWQGSTDKINWQKFSTASKSIDFGEIITAESVKQLLIHSNFRLLSNDFLVLYYSGLNPPILVDATLLKDYLFDFMQEFAFLNGVLFFEPRPLANNFEKMDFIEVRIFDTITGQILC